MTAVWLEDTARERMRLLLVAEAARLAEVSITPLELLEGLAQLRDRVKAAAGNALPAPGHGSGLRSAHDAAAGGEGYGRC